VGNNPISLIRINASFDRDIRAPEFLSPPASTSLITIATLKPPFPAPVLHNRHSCSFGQWPDAFVTQKWRCNTILLRAIGLSGAEFYDALIHGKSMGFAEIALRNKTVTLG